MPGSLRCYNFPLTGDYVEYQAPTATSLSIAIGEILRKFSVEGFCEIALVEVALFENSVPNPRLKFPIFFPFQWLHLEVYPSTVMAP